MTDQELLEKFGKPETKHLAFEQLVRLYQQRIYWHVRKMVIDHDDADDLTQETFIKAWESLDKFRADAQIFTWLYRIASNGCIDFLNKKRRRLFVPIHDVSHELAAKMDDDPLLSGDEIQLRLQKALLRLPDKQRLVFNMKYFDDLKYEQIADITGTSVGALKASYHLAVKKIEAFLTVE